jgi:hypothetical protein
MHKDMRHIRLYENFQEEQPVTLEDNAYSLWVEYPVSYESGKIYMQLRLIKTTKMIRVDFEAESIKPLVMDDDDIMDEALQPAQLELFTRMKRMIEEFAQEHGSNTIYFQAKQSRVNIYDQLAQTFAEGYKLLRYHESRLKRGKDWWIFIKNEAATPKYVKEVEELWQRSVQAQIEYGGMVQTI